MTAADMPEACPPTRRRCVQTSDTALEPRSTETLTSWKLMPERSMATLPNLKPCAASCSRVSSRSARCPDCVVYMHAWPD
eukprot:1159016-Pelagomonas_calceolata.AAC.8